MLTKEDIDLALKQLKILKLDVTDLKIRAANLETLVVNIMENLNKEKEKLT